MHCILDFDDVQFLVGCFDSRTRLALLQVFKFIHLGLTALLALDKTNKSLNGILDLLVALILVCFTNNIVRSVVTERLAASESCG